MQPLSIRASATAASAQFQGFSSVREVVCRPGQLGARKRELHCALTNHQPLVLRGGLSVTERAEVERQWVANVHGAGGEVQYTTSRHGQKALREVWDTLVAMQIESGVHDEGVNSILQWLEQPDASPLMRRLLGLFRQLQDAAAESSSGIAEIRNPAFINGQRPDQSPTTHFDDYESIVLVVTGMKVFFLAEYDTFKDFPVRGKVNERAGINPFNLVCYAPGQSSAHLDRCEQGDWSVAVLEPGDALYLPQGFWHWVQSEPKTTMMNHWWVNRDAVSPLPAAGERRLVFARLRGRGAEVQDSGSSSNTWVRPNGYDSGEALDEHNAPDTRPMSHAMANYNAVRFDLDGSSSDDDSDSVYSDESIASVQPIDNAWLPLVLAYLQYGDGRWNWTLDGRVIDPHAERRCAESAPTYLMMRSVCTGWRDEVGHYNPVIYRHGHSCWTLEWFLSAQTLMDVS